MYSLVKFDEQLRKIKKKLYLIEKNLIIYIKMNRISLMYNSS